MLITLPRPFILDAAKMSPEWQRLTDDLYATWQAIANDVTIEAEDDEEAIQEQRMEMCIEHLEMYGSSMSSAYFKTLAAMHGYDTIEAALNQVLRLGY